MFLSPNTKVSVLVPTKNNKNKINFTIYTSSILKNIRYISIELLEENLYFTVKSSNIWRERGYITAEGLYLEFLEEQYYKAINFA